MHKETLEAICTEVDGRIRDGRQVRKKDILDKYEVHDRTRNTYKSFIDDYADISREYLTSIGSVKDNIESEVGESDVSDINWERISWNAVFGGVMGNSLPYSIYSIAVCAAGSALLTFYVEAKNKEVSLSPMFWGAVLGSWIGGWVSPENKSSIYEIYKYSGAALGLLLGSVQFYREFRAGAAEEQSAQPELTEFDLTHSENKYKTQKAFLITSTAEKLERVLSTGSSHVSLAPGNDKNITAS